MGRVKRDCDDLIENTENINTHMTLVRWMSLLSASDFNCTNCYMYDEHTSWSNILSQLCCICLGPPVVTNNKYKRHQDYEANIRKHYFMTHIAKTSIPGFQQVSTDSHVIIFTFYWYRIRNGNGCVEAGNFNEGTIISDQNVANTGCAKHIDLRGRQKHWTT